MKIPITEMTKRAGEKCCIFDFNNLPVRKNETARKHLPLISKYGISNDDIVITCAIVSETNSPTYGFFMKRIHYCPVKVD